MRLDQQFPNNIMDLDTGMCTALSKVLSLSLPDAWTVRTFSPFFTTAERDNLLSSERLINIDMEAEIGNELGE